MRAIQILVEKHDDGFIAYPLDVHGGCVGQGDSHAKALADCQRVLKAHVATFGREVLQEDPIGQKARRRLR
jgi:predicted RNase H-like HicB family nuclease